MIKSFINGDSVVVVLSFVVPKHPGSTLAHLENYQNIYILVNAYKFDY